MGPNLDSCALTRGNLRVCGGSNFSSFNKTSSRSSNGTIIGRNGVVCCLDGTSSSDRRAIECPKTRQRSHVINGSFEVSAPAPPSSFFLERRREELPHAAPFLGGHRFAMFATAGQ